MTKRGRPSKFTEALAREIFERLSQGEPLAVICRDAHMPCPSTVYDWVEKRPELSQAIARARELGFDQIAWDALAIADDKSTDTKVVGDDGREVCDTEWVQRSKLRVETRLKLLAKWDPKRYGDKMQIGGDAEGGPLVVVIRKPD